jgi:peroxiredoxin
MKKPVIATVSACFFAATATAAPAIGKPAPDFTGKNYDGSQVKLSDQKGKTVVLEWTNAECPFVKKHYDSGNMQKLQEYAQGKDVVWMSVNSGAPGKQGHIDPAKAKDHFSGASIKANYYLIDEAGTIGRLYDAKTTPHMFVIDSKGTLVYSGAIDDNSSADPKTIEGAKNYVQNAIDSVIAGKPVDPSATQSYGCSVKYGS